MAINDGILNQLMELSSEEKVPNFMLLFFNQNIIEDKRFAKLLRDQADDVRSRLTKMNQMKRDLEAKEDQEDVIDNLDTLKDYIKNDNAMLDGISKLQEIVKDVIDDKETNVKLMDISDQDYVVIANGYQVVVGLICVLVGLSLFCV
ncbi:hypothetical protein Tco_1577227 [Tanacetum coccineum]